MRMSGLSKVEMSAFMGGWGPMETERIALFGVLHLFKLIPSFEDETEALASFQPLTYSAKP